MFVRLELLRALVLSFGALGRDRESREPINFASTGPVGGFWCGRVVFEFDVADGGLFDAPVPRPACDEIFARGHARIGRRGFAGRAE